MNRIFFSVLLTWMSIMSMAQTRSVTGEVTDKDTKDKIRAARKAQ